MKEIPLTQNKVTIVDDEDFEVLTQSKWCAHKVGRMYYAVQGKKPNLMMHRVLLNPPSNLCIDHINRNGLDNRRENLRLCTKAQNQMNKRKKITNGHYKGVSLSGRTNLRKRWRTSICYCGNPTEVGWFPDPVSAAVAYDISAILLFGEFACLDFPGCYA